MKNVNNLHLKDKRNLLSFKCIKSFEHWSLLNLCNMNGRERSKKNLKVILSLHELLKLSKFPISFKRTQIAGAPTKTN